MFLCFCDVRGGGGKEEEEKVKILAISSRTICWEIHQRLVHARVILLMINIRVLIHSASSPR